MAVLSIEGNGLLEKTAVYYNGSQISGIKEIFVNLDEDGTFDALIQYEGTDKELYTKQVFEDYLNNIKIVSPSFTEEESKMMQLFTIDSDGSISGTTLFLNEEQLEGVVSALIHIKATKNESNFLSFLKKKDIVESETIFKASLTFRYSEDVVETEDIFL